MAKKNEYVAVGEPYRLRDRAQNMGSSAWEDVPATWWEYEVDLMREGRIVASFDSLTGHEDDPRHLTKRECLAAIREIVRDVRAGEIEKWFGKGAWSGPDDHALDRPDRSR